MNSALESLQGDPRGWSTGAREDSRAGPIWAEGAQSKAGRPHTRFQRTQAVLESQLDPHRSHVLSIGAEPHFCLEKSKPGPPCLPPPFSSSSLLHLSSPHPIQESRPKSGPTWMNWPPIKGSSGWARYRPDIKGEGKVRIRDIRSRARMSMRGAGSG